jgi:hypothetical protein
MHPDNFLVGCPEPVFLERTDAPLFVSYSRLINRKSLPRAKGPWALDSSGFSHLRKHGEWIISPQQYIKAVCRYRDEIGNLMWAAPQDWMVEDDVLEITGLTEADHTARTIFNYLDLKSIDDTLPIIPVLQAKTILGYVASALQYRAFGIDLWKEPVVGLGSVCKRQNTAEIAEIVWGLHSIGLTNLHGFGVKLGGIKLYAGGLLSADSQAWSYDARYSRPPIRLEGHTHMNCASCMEWMLIWRQRVVDRLQDQLLSA